MTPEEVLSIETSGYTYQPSGDMDSKSFPMDIILPPNRVDVVNRVLFTWNNRFVYPTGGGVNESVIGHHAKRTTAGTIKGETTTRISMANGNGMHVWVQPSSILDTSQPLTVSGTSIDECGTETASDTEDITIDSTVDKVYVTDKRWTGTVTLKSKVEGVAADLNIVTDAGVVAPWNCGRAAQVFEALSVRWRPWDTPWRIDIDANIFTPGDTTPGSGGLVPIGVTGPSYPRTFRDIFTPARGAVGLPGADWCSQISQWFNPMVNEGAVVRLNVRGFDAVDLWATFYRY